jgi:copper chaperone CopZ
MEKNYITVTLKIRGMTCVSCENRIERTLKNKKGVANAIVSYGKGTALVTYNPDQTDQEEIIEAITRLGYEAVGPNETADAKPVRRYAVRQKWDTAGSLYESETRNSNGLQAIGILVILLALYVIVRRSGGLDLLNFSRSRSGYGFRDAVRHRLLTSAHCVAMWRHQSVQCVPYQARGTGGTGNLL